MYNVFVSGHNAQISFYDQNKKARNRANQREDLKMKKKIALFLVAAMTVASLAACGNSAEPAAAPAEEEAAAPEQEEAAPAETEAEAEAPAEGEAAAPADAGSVAVFYYTYGDTYKIGRAHV